MNELVQCTVAVLKLEIDRVSVTELKMSNKNKAFTATPWGQDPKLQPMSRSVDHTISMMIYAMEVETAGTDNLQLTEQETAAWVKEKKLHDKVEYATRQMS